MSTVKAQAVNLKKMGNHFPSQGVFNFRDYLFFTAELKILDLPAGYADKVMMMIGVAAVVII